MATRLRIALTILLCLCAACIGCSEKKPSSDTSEITIAVVPKGTTHEFWKSVHAGALRAAKELGISIIWKGALREDSREDQIQIVEEFINRGVSGIVLSPMDESALQLPVRSATQSGVPVVIMDSGLKGADYTSFVATDNYAGGVLAANHLAELIGQKGRVIMLRYQEGSDSTASRERAFLDTMKNYPDITIVSANQFAGATAEGAYRASENLLAPLKTSSGSLDINGIFAACEPTTFGMLRALQDIDQAGKVNFVGFDATEKLVQSLRDGQITSLIVQNPVKIGYLSVKTMVEHLRGGAVEKRIDTGVTLVTRENMNDPEIATLISPDLSVLKEH